MTYAAVTRRRACRAYLPSGRRVSHVGVAGASAGCQLASAAVTGRARTAVTSIRAGEPSTDAPQLSGRGGADAPCTTVTRQRRPSRWARVTSQRGATPSVRTTVRAWAVSSPRAERRASSAAWPGRSHAEFPQQSSTTIRFSRALCRISLTAMGLDPAVDVPVGQHEHGR
ncbi:hypothetical protein STENM36S_06228 [Streptomyces tendae]